jgi:hypothetical protein
VTIHNHTVFPLYYVYQVVFGCNIYAETPSYQYKIFRGHGWSFHVYNIILYLCVCVCVCVCVCEVYVGSVIMSIRLFVQPLIILNTILNEIICICIYTCAPGYVAQRCKFFSRRINRIAHFLTVVYTQYAKYYSISYIGYNVLPAGWFVLCIYSVKP